jgi:hypothetical protein
MERGDIYTRNKIAPIFTLQQTTNNTIIFSPTIYKPLPICLNRLPSFVWHTGNVTLVLVDIKFAYDNDR